MALHLCYFFANCTFTKLPLTRQLGLSQSGPSTSKVRCMGLPQSGRSTGKVRCMVGPNQTIVRRSANYQPPIWDHDFVQSLSNDYVGEMSIQQINELKKDVKKMLSEALTPLDLLELIDALQRLGLAYHFEDEIKKILKSIYSHTVDNNLKEEDLHAAALQFRLVRQYGFDISQEIFRIFQDGMGNFKTCLCEDIEGILSLYEASYLAEEGDNILDVAREFTTTCLKKYVTEQNKDQYISIIINHSLEMPLHWRMPRLEARWFIDVYERKQGISSLLLELAKLDFNYVQATHQEDLKYASWWWRNTGLGDKLSFARDRLIENFLWTVGLRFEPQFGYGRRMITKINALITTIDDIYDVYGTLDELQLFTDAVERWDVNAMDQLPDYMKICFLALHNSINEIAYDALKEQGLHIIPYLKNAWADLCKSYLLEAKWYYSGYTPTLQEYMDNGWVSISAPLILTHAYFLQKRSTSNDAWKCFSDCPNIIRWSSMIIRHADDLGTSSDELKRGDVPKSIQCYMHESGASEAEAREHIKYLIIETWKKVNKERVAVSSFSKTFNEITINFVRMAQCMYQHGDGHGIEDGETKNRVLSLFVHPIPTKVFWRNTPANI